MKSKIFYFLFFIILTSGCESTSKTSSLNLVSPNGVEIAKDINTLKSNIAVFLNSINEGQKNEFEITNIEYITVIDGFAAFVQYKLENGDVRKFLLFSGNPNIQQVAKTVAVRNLRIPDTKDGLTGIICTGTCIEESTGLCELIIKKIDLTCPAPVDSGTLKQPVLEPILKEEIRIDNPMITLGCFSNCEDCGEMLIVLF